MRGNVRLVVLALPLVTISLAGLLAPWAAPQSPTSTDLSASLLPPSGGHWLGTDQLGRDQLSRIIWAARTSMTVTAAVMVVSFVVGVTVGALGAYLGGVVDRVVTWVVELALSVPSMLLALAVLGIRGNSAPNLILALSVVGWAAYARIARGAVFGYRGSPAADALVGLGAHPVRIVAVHVVPTAARPAAVFASTDVGVVVLTVAGLSFLGLGISPPTPEWGQMLVESRPYLGSAWWLWLPPGLAVTAVALSSNLIGEHLGIAPELRRWRLRRMPDASRRTVARGVGRDSEQPVPSAGREPLLRVSGLRVDLDTPAGPVTALHGVDYAVRPGEVLALVGESGSGKTVSVMGPLGLLDASARVTGRASYQGTELIGAPEETLRQVRGAGVAVVFQDPYAALNPLRTVGSVVAEALRPPARGDAARERVKELLEAVGLPRPDVTIDQYPHELSGGMRQRVLIAAALAGEPTVLIADEPTSSLDVTVQSEILDLLRDLGRRRDMAVVLISHDLAVVADVADRVLVMYAGRAVEEAPTGALISSPLHPYTRGLIDAVPVVGRPTGTRFATLPESDHVSAGREPVDGGCSFAGRCVLREEACLTGAIPLSPAAAAHPDGVEGLTGGHQVACPPALVRAHHRQHEPEAAR
ncbi:dipeptide/oligopeptide/nickel ABC transporter permease/ATP-binding protein [Mumia sp. zg.B53]|uniref:dipeptide/oligopeptide/nickel ABC transporter permease/ATP-binding protein n=1 Tax=Mumia sp. zg.B53 TaxID=2855449 RepID=UPI001C6F3B1F|nr:dipeptide/oligopeptide/nickel ABC transporter permease/ATP-binding protein [Mumia sp. zg.B53]MBW9215951.1 dipeptide/oligopeptide/nickel ABC transporter permease/ATP-binding protein [Mumia sp. zg.B53]